MSTTRAGQTGRWVPARLLPRASPFIPRATRWKLSVSVSICLAIWGTGALLAAVGPVHARTAAMALMLPGGGHLASGHIYRAIFALAAFGLSLLIWWMIGAVIAPIIVWLGILAEATLGHSHAPLSVAGAWVTTGSVPAILGSSLVVYSVRRYRQRATARTLNHELASVRFFRTAVPSTTEPAVSEASADDLAHLRFAIDLALQPLDEFTGFDRRDQFREAALRYQLCILGYALSMYRYTHTPAFSGYLDEAQQKAIVKMGNKQVWGYWAAENVWGRFSPNRDPVNNRDNVMLTGWQGVAVGMYESFGDDRFSRPGGLTYTWSDTQEFQHDFHTLAASIHRNFRRSPFTLFSCEPRWIYPVCNTFGVNTLVLHDRLHGTEYFRELEEAIDGAFENEFQRPDGRLIGVRNETLGLSWNIWASEGVSLPTTYWMNACLPAHAERAWWLLKRDSLVHDGERYLLPKTVANRCDVGNYTLGSDAFAQTFLSLAAREIGDNDVADSAFAYVDSTQKVIRREGVARYAGLSTQGNLYSLLARFARPAANRDLIGAGLPARWRTGPRLAEAAYPEVSVSRAVTDGHALDLTLRPGAGPLRTTLVVDRLISHGEYRVRGGLDPTVTADEHGCALVSVDLEDRTVLRIEPTR
ncbi:hypothetical protein ACFWBG_25905 [Nocardia salmonicida]|uniref:linalool dehydratase/isomerase domain-containing protein n=1 Tax=Nocardia salmonicida TaxID=53431 RepID=UPI00366AD31F